MRTLENIPDMNASIVLALAAAPLGCACIYLASPHQRWRDRAWPAGPARGLGGLLLAISLFALGQGMQAVTAAFVFVTFLMLLFALLPYLGALVSPRRR